MLDDLESERRNESSSSSRAIDEVLSTKPLHVFGIGSLSAFIVVTLWFVLFDCSADTCGNAFDRLIMLVFSPVFFFILPHIFVPAVLAGGILTLAISHLNKKNRASVISSVSEEKLRLLADKIESCTSVLRGFQRASQKLVGWPIEPTPPLTSSAISKQP